MQPAQKDGKRTMELAKYRPHEYPPRTHYPDGNRQAFHNSRASLGATHHPRAASGLAGHWVHLLSVAAPLAISELIKDAEKRFRAMRAVTVGTAILSEAVWTWRLAQDRKKDDEARAALQNCEERSL
jgi:hypothetical protein